MTYPPAQSLLNVLPEHFVVQHPFLLVFRLVIDLFVSPIPLCRMTHPLPTRPPPHHQAANLPPGNAAFATAETTLDPTWNFRHATALDMSSSVPKNRRTRQTGRVIAFNIAIHIASPNLVCQVHTSCWQHHHDNDATPVPPHARSTTKVSATPPYALTSTDIPTRPLTDDDDD